MVLGNFFGVALAVYVLSVRTGGAGLARAIAGWGLMLATIVKAINNRTV